MTVDEFQQEKARLVALYGAAPREASDRRAQEFALLYAKSGWTQRELAKHEGISQSSMFHKLVFGKFLLWLITSCNQPWTRTDGYFRTLWETTNQTKTAEERFAEIAEMIRTPPDTKETKETPHSRKDVQRLSKQLIARFTDGKWHSLADIAAAVEATRPMVRSIMDRIVREGTYETFAERRHAGKGSYSYRLVKGGGKKIDLQVFQTEMKKTLEDMDDLINGHQVHFSQSLMQTYFAEFRKVLDKLTR